MIKTISELHIQKTGKISDKWESYLDFYDEVFAPLMHAPISLLEIGIQNGGSLDTWSSYFHNSEVLIGCDIDEKCKLLQYQDPKVQVVIGDANHERTTEDILKIKSAFDIVIDDGSHTSNDILTSFLIYFPHLKPGGIYIVEDMHTLYENSFGGGILNDLSAMSFFKKLVDFVNVQFWGNQLHPAIFFRTFFDGNSLPSFMDEGWVESVEFRNSIIVIKKAKKSGHEKLGRRIISGSQLTVKDQKWLDKLK